MINPLHLQNLIITPNLFFGRSSRLNHYKDKVKVLQRLSLFRLLIGLYRQG